MQSFTDWELVLVEDGSRDRTEELVQAFAKNVRQPVRFLRHEKNQGLPATRNTGIALARSEWIVLLDSDDLWTPDHLADLVECARRNPSASLVHSGSVLFDSDSGRELELRAPSPAITASYPLSLFLGSYIVQPSSVMLKKSLWSKVGGFDPAFRYVEDREMWMRCARAGAVFAFTGRNTCRYRKHATALTTHAGPMAIAAAQVYDKAADWDAIPGPLRRAHAAAGWTAAGRIVLRENPRAARRYFSHALRHRASPTLIAYWSAAALLGLVR
jgi:glycosyltransferase involved in cell wall biosynthesis